MTKFKTHISNWFLAYLLAAIVLAAVGISIHQLVNTLNIHFHLYLRRDMQHYFVVQQLDHSGQMIHGRDWSVLWLLKWAAFYALIWKGIFGLWAWYTATTKERPMPLRVLLDKIGDGVLTLLFVPVVIETVYAASTYGRFATSNTLGVSAALMGWWGFRYLLPQYREDRTIWPIWSGWAVTFALTGWFLPAILKHI